MMLEATSRTSKRVSYPEYKDSGIEWLGDVPAHWEIKVTRQGFRIQLGKMLQPYARSPQDSEVPYFKAQHVQWETVSTADLPSMWSSPSEEAQYGISTGDLLVCEGGEVGRAGIVRNPPPKAIIQNALHRVRPVGANDTRFLMYVLEHASSQSYIDILCNRSTIAHFTMGKFGNLKILFPPSLEQLTIADFLDHQTEKIDTLVAKKRTLIERLKEERTALITHTINRGLPPEAARAAGLDPHPKLKFSGVEWLGEVPEHWEVISLKWLATTASGDGISAEDIISECNQTYSIPVMGGNGLMGYTGKCNTISQVLVIGRVGALCGNVHVVSTPVWVTDNALILTLNKNILNLRYLMSVLHARNLNEIADKTAQPLITGTKIRAESVPVPPTSEQAAIADFLDRATTKIDTLVTKIETAIERLQEYRSALITAAVTGKIDVRKEAAL